MIDANCPVISLRVYRMVILSRSSLLFDRTKFERAGMIITSEIILQYMENARIRMMVIKFDTMFSINVNVYRFESSDPSYQWQIFYLGRKWLVGKM